MGISKALVVDDSRLARVALTKLLTKRGLEVDTAACGSEALEYLRESIPDVVFIDYMMPDMTGFQTADAINHLLGEGQLPMVMYTSQDTPEDRRRAEDLGVCGFLTKPSSEEGLDHVLDVLGKWQAKETPSAASGVPESVVADMKPGLEVDLASKPDKPVDELLNEIYVSSDPAMQAGPAAGRPDKDKAFPDLFVPAQGGGAQDVSSARPPEVSEQNAQEQAPPANPASRGDEADNAPVAMPAAAAGNLKELEPRMREISSQVVQEALASTRVDWRRELKDLSSDLQQSTIAAANLAGRKASDQLGQIEQVETRMREISLEVVREAMASVRDGLKKELNDLSTGLQENTLASAALASREVSDRLGREVRDELHHEWSRLQGELHEASVSNAEKAAKGIADSVARNLAEEIAEVTARRVATQLMEEHAEQIETDLVGRDKRDITAEARLALVPILEALGEDSDFQSQITAVVIDRGVPLIKNALDHWVRELAEETAEATVRDAVERSIDALVEEAIIASAETAVQEVYAAQSKSKTYIIIGVVGWLVLAIGVVFSF